MSFEIEPVNRQSLSRQIADQLQQAIFEGTFKADQRLPTEEELGRRYQVSRPTIREALKRLAARNLIRSKRGPTGGSFVNQPNLEQLGDQLSSAVTLLVGMNSVTLPEILEARAELETLCCKLCILHGDEQYFEQMESTLLLQSEANISDEAFCDADIQFHRVLAESTGNRIIALQMYALIEALQPVTNMLVNRSRERSIIIQQHQQLLSALKLKNIEESESIIRQQVHYLRERYEQSQNKEAAQP